MTLAEAFQQIRIAFISAGVTYAIGGSWASTVDGEPRHTNDIDFVTNLDANRVRLFLEALGSGFYFHTESAHDAVQNAVQNGRPFNVIHQKLGYKFDFFPVVDSHGDAELERRIAVALPALDSELVPVISADDTFSPSCAGIGKAAKCPTASGETSPGSSPLPAGNWIAPISSNGPRQWG